METKDKILIFVDEHLRTVDKWKDKDWLMGEYKHHIEETNMLRKKKHPHLQAELLDKAIISGCLYRIYPGNIHYLDNSIKELSDDIMKNGFVEFPTFDELFESRKEKFLSKLNLNSNIKPKETIHIISLKENQIPKIYYVKSGTHNNAVMEYNGQKLRYRGEVLVFRNDFKEVFLCETDKDYRDDGKYYLPGGSAEPNVSIDEQIVAECREEAGLEIKNMEHSGVQYIKDFNGNYPKWHAKYLHPNGLVYDGYFTELFIAEYDGPLKKEVKNKKDIDPYMREHGKFYSVESVKGSLPAEHREVIDNIQKILSDREKPAPKDSYIPASSKYYLYEKDNGTYATKNLVRSQLLEISIEGLFFIEESDDLGKVNSDIITRKDGKDLKVYIRINKHVDQGHPIIIGEEDDSYMNSFTDNMFKEYNKFRDKYHPLKEEV